MPAYASPLPTVDAQIHTDLASAITKLTSILSSVDGLEGYTDQLEGLITTLNTHVDGLEGLLSPPLLVDSSTGDQPQVEVDNVYDEANNLLTEVEELPSGVTRTWTYTYDGAGNLLTETYVDA